MAIIPRFNSGNAIAPAQQNNPVLDRERRPRVDAGAIIGALGQSAQAFAGFGQQAQAPTMPLDTYDGKYRGVNAIVQGAQSLNDALSGIAIARAEAKNYADVTNAVMGMEKVAGEFADWSMRPENAARPEAWADEWEGRITSYRNAVQANGDLSPAAREEVNRRLAVFSQREGIRVQTSATKATFQKARETGLARVMEAGRNGDVETGVAELDRLEELGLVDPVEKLRQQYALEDEVESKRISDMADTVERLLLEGETEPTYEEAKQKFDQAKELIRDSDLRDAEKSLQVAKIERVSEIEAKARDLHELAFSEPEKALEELETVGADGKPRFHKDLPWAKRRQLAQVAYQSLAEMQEMALNDIIDRAGQGGIDSIDHPEIQAQPYFSKLTDAQKLKANQMLQEGRPNSPAEYTGMLAKIYGSNLADPTGMTVANLRFEINSRFENEYAAELNNRIDEALSGIEEARGQGTIANGFSRMKADLYGQIDQALKEGVFGQFEVPYRDAGRVSQQDMAAREEGKIGRGDFVTDLNLRDQAAQKAMEVQKRMEQWEQSNPNATIEEMQQELQRQIGTTSGLQSSSVIESSYGEPFALPGGFSREPDASLFPGADAMAPDEEKEFTDMLRRLAP